MKKLADISQFEAIQDKANRDMGLVSSMSVFNKMDYDAVAKIFLDGMRKSARTGKVIDIRKEFATEALRSFIALVEDYKSYNEFLEAVKTDCEILKERIVDGTMQIEREEHLLPDSAELIQEERARVEARLSRLIETLNDLLVIRVGEQVIDRIHANQVNFTYWADYLLDAWVENGRDYVITGHEFGEMFAEQFLRNNPRLVNIDDQLFGFNDDLDLMKRGYKSVTVGQLSKLMTENNPEIQGEHKDRLLASISSNIDVMMDEAQRSGEAYLRNHNNA